MLIGLCGYAQSGKDTLGALLVRHNAFERRAFADPMRQMLYAMNPFVLTYEETGQPNLKRVRAIVDTYGWEYAKKHSEVRDLLQRLGTEGGRDILGDDVWVEALFHRPYEDLVITDVRFQNEADAIHARGGTILRVVRDGVSAANSHISEFSYNDQDHIIFNDGTIFDLHEKFLEMFRLV
jgi:hypothetical protein